MCWLDLFALWTFEQLNDEKCFSDGVDLTGELCWEHFWSCSELERARELTAVEEVAQVLWKHLLLPLRAVWRWRTPDNFVLKALQGTWKAPDSNSELFEWVLPVWSLPSSGISVMGCSPWITGMLTMMAWAEAANSVPFCSHSFLMFLITVSVVIGGDCTYAPGNVLVCKTPSSLVRSSITLGL